MHHTMLKDHQFGCLAILVLVLIHISLYAPKAIAEEQKGVNNDAQLTNVRFPLRDDKDYDNLADYDDDEDYGQNEYTDLKDDEADDDDDDGDGDGDGNSNEYGIDGNLFASRATNKPYSATSITFCPEKCSCLGDFIECKNLNLQLPSLPTSVQELELSQNNLGDKLCEQSIGNLTGLEKLRLKHNQLTRMPIFVGLNALHTLILANNNIQIISTEALLAIPRLTQLDLSRNNIKTILPSSFPSGNIIEKINLNHNKIANLERNSFAATPKLVELKLNHNRIEALPIGFFSELKKLKKLSLSGNQLGKSIQWATFSNLSSLISLKLRNNFIKELITGVFHGLNNLSVLDLSNNEIGSVQKNGLHNITSLAKLLLANNSIISLEPGCWEFSQKINHLDLSGNQLTNLSSESFEFLSKLKHLDLRQNAISTINSGTFNATPNLQTLDLSYNQISWTIEDMYAPFLPLKSLDRLNLNDNQIKSITSHSFLGLKSLTWLDLSNNNVTSLQLNAFETKTTPLLKNLQLNSNDLICDCNMLWFFMWLRRTSGNRRSQVVTMNYNENVATNRLSHSKIDATCAYPMAIKGKKLMELHKNNFTCNETPKPRMFNEAKSQILAIKGSNITLNCTAASTSNSRITFKWKHDNVEISKDLVETKLNRKPKDPLSRKQQRNRRDIDSDSMLPIESSITGLKYEKYGVDDDDGNDDDDEERPHEIGVPENQDTPIPPNSTIAVSHITLENVDQQHAGRYQCIATNRFGTTYSQKFKVTVASLPKFTKQPTNVTVGASNTVRLDCAVDGDPKPQIYWQFNFGNDFPAARERRMHVMPQDDAFFIVQTKASDQGVYTCTAENPAGIIRANATVQVLEEPTFVKPMENKDVLIGESGVLECMKSGSPTPTLRWYKEGPNESQFTLIEMTDRHFFTAEDQLLIIVKTTEEDAGTYKCEMENKIGKVSATMKLTVRTSADYKNGSGQLINVDEMTCIVIITVVCCAVGTSIIWVVIIYQTKKESSCSIIRSRDNGPGISPGGLPNNGNFEKGMNVLAATTTSTLLISDGAGGKPEPQHPLRTATISNGRSILRSSSCGNSSHSSAGPFDDMYQKYPNTGDYNTVNSRNTLRSNKRTPESDDDENIHDSEALLGSAYFGLNGGACYHQPRKKHNDMSSTGSNVTTSSITKDNVFRRSRDCLDTTTITTNTDDCELVEKYQPSSVSNDKLRTSNSLSASSSCDSISPLPYSASHELTNQIPCNNSISSGSISSVTPPLSTFQMNNEHQQNLLNQQKAPLLNNKSPSRPIYRDSSRSPVPSPLIQPKIHIPIPPRKPNIQMNKLNELVTTLNN